MSSIKENGGSFSGNECVSKQDFAPVLWLTGLSGAGKSTLAGYLAGRLRAEGRLVEILDGDDLRAGLSADLGFTRRDREVHNHRVIYVAKLLSRNGITVIVPMISPYREIRKAALAQLPGYFEVHVRCSLDECIRRDPKGLYRRALAGEIRNFTGLDDPYEEPLSPEVMVDTERCPVEKCVDVIIGVLADKLSGASGNPAGSTTADARDRGPGVNQGSPAGVGKSRPCAGM